MRERRVAKARDVSNDQLKDTERGRGHSRTRATVQESLLNLTQERDGGRRRGRSRTRETFQDAKQKQPENTRGCPSRYEDEEEDSPPSANRGRTIARSPLRAAGSGPTMARSPPAATETGRTMEDSPPSANRGRTKARSPLAATDTGHTMDDSPLATDRGRTMARSGRRTRAKSLDRYAAFEDRISSQHTRTSGYDSDYGRVLQDGERPQVKLTARERSSRFNRYQKATSSPEKYSDSQRNKLDKYLPKNRRRNQLPEGGAAEYTSAECCIVEINSATSKAINTVRDTTSQEYYKNSKIPPKANIVLPQPQTGSEFVRNLQRSNSISPAVCVEADGVDGGVELECDFCNNAYSNNADLEDHFMTHFSSLPKLHAFLNAHRSRLTLLAERKNKVQTVSSLDKSASDFHKDDSFERTRNLEGHAMVSADTKHNNRQADKNENKRRKKHNVSFEDDSIATLDPDVTDLHRNIGPDQNELFINQSNKVKEVQVNKSGAKRLKGCGRKTVIQNTFQNECDMPYVVDSEVSVATNQENTTDRKRKKNLKGKVNTVSDISETVAIVQVVPEKALNKTMQKKLTKQKIYRSEIAKSKALQNDLGRKSEQLVGSKDEDGKTFTQGIIQPEKDVSCVLETETSVEVGPHKVDLVLKDKKKRRSRKKVDVTSDISKHCSLQDEPSIKGCKEYVSEEQVIVEDNVMSAKLHAVQDESDMSSIFESVISDESTPGKLHGKYKRLNHDLKKKTPEPQSSNKLHNEPEKRISQIEGHYERMEESKLKTVKQSLQNQIKSYNTMIDLCKRKTLKICLKRLRPVDYKKFVRDVLGSSSSETCESTPDLSDILHSSASESAITSDVETESPFTTFEENMSTAKSVPKTFDKPFPMDTNEPLELYPSSKSNEILKIDGTKTIQKDIQELELANKDVATNLEDTVIMPPVILEKCTSKLSDTKTRKRKRKKDDDKSDSSKLKVMKVSPVVSKTEEELDLAEEYRTFTDNNRGAVRYTEVHNQGDSTNETDITQTSIEDSGEFKKLDSQLEDNACSETDLDSTLNSSSVSEKLVHHTKTGKQTRKKHPRVLCPSLFSSFCTGEMSGLPGSGKITENAQNHNDSTDESAKKEISNLNRHSPRTKRKTEQDSMHIKMDVENESSAAEHEVQSVDKLSKETIALQDDSYNDTSQTGEHSKQTKSSKVKVSNMKKDYKECNDSSSSSDMGRAEGVNKRKVPNIALKAKRKVKTRPDKLGKISTNLVESGSHDKKKNKKKTKRVPESTKDDKPVMDLNISDIALESEVISSESEDPLIASCDRLEEDTEDNTLSSFFSSMADQGLEIVESKSCDNAETKNPFNCDNSVSDMVPFDEISRELNNLGNSSQKAVPLPVESIINECLEVLKTDEKKSSDCINNNKLSIDEPDSGNSVLKLKFHLRKDENESTKPKWQLRMKPKNGIQSEPSFDLISINQIENKSDISVNIDCTINDVDEVNKEVDNVKHKPQVNDEKVVSPSVSQPEVETHVPVEISGDSKIDKVRTAGPECIVDATVPVLPLPVKYPSANVSKQSVSDLDSTVNSDSVQQSPDKGRSSSRDRLLYQCEVCHMRYRSVSSLRFHSLQQQHHNSCFSTEHECSICKMRFDVKEDCLTHQNNCSLLAISEMLNTNQPAWSDDKAKDQVKVDQIAAIAEQIGEGHAYVDKEVKSKDRKVSDEKAGPSDVRKAVISADENSNIQIIFEKVNENRSNERTYDECGNGSTTTKCQLDETSSETGQKRESRSLPSGSSDSETVSESTSGIATDKFEILKGETDMKIILKKVELENFTEDGLQLQFFGSPVSPKWKVSEHVGKSESDEKCLVSEIDSIVEREHDAFVEDLISGVYEQPIALVQESATAMAEEGRTVNNTTTEKSRKEDVSSKNEKHERKKLKKQMSVKTHKCDKEVEQSEQGSAMNDFEKAITNSDTVIKKKPKKSKTKSVVKSISRQLSSETTSSQESNRDVVSKKKMTTIHNLESSQPFHNSKTAQRIYMEAQRKAEQLKNGEDILDVSEGNKKHTLPPFSVLLESGKRDSGGKLSNNLVSSNTDALTTQSSVKALKSNLASIGIVANKPNPKLKDIMNSSISFGTMDSSLNRSSLFNFGPQTMKIPKLSDKDVHGAEKFRIPRFDPDRSLPLHKSPLDNCYAYPPSQSFTNIDCNFIDNDNRLNQSSIDNDATSKRLNQSYMSNRVNQSSTDYDITSKRLNQSYPCASTSSQNVLGKQKSGNGWKGLFSETGDFIGTGDSMGFEQSYTNDISNVSETEFDKMKDLSSESQLPTFSDSVVSSEVQSGANQTVGDVLSVSWQSRSWEKSESHAKPKRKLTRYQIPEKVTTEGSGSKPEEPMPAESLSMLSIRSAEVSMMDGLDMTLPHNEDDDSISNTQGCEADIPVKFIRTFNATNSLVGKHLSAKKDEFTSKSVKLKDANDSKKVGTQGTFSRMNDQYARGSYDDGVDMQQAVSEELDYDLHSFMGNRSEPGDISDADSYDHVLLRDHKPEISKVDAVQKPSEKNPKYTLADQQTVGPLNEESEEMAVDEDSPTDQDADSSALCAVMDTDDHMCEQRSSYDSVQWNRDLKDNSVTPSPVSDIEVDMNKPDEHSGSNESTSRTESPVSDVEFDRNKPDNDSKSSSRSESPVSNLGEAEGDDSNSGTMTETMTEVAEDGMAGLGEGSDAGGIELDYNDDDVIDLFADDEDASFLDAESVTNEFSTEEQALKTQSCSQASADAAPKKMDLESPDSPAHNDHNTLEVYPPKPVIEPRGPPTSRWMPPGFCFHYCNNRPCKKKPCPYKHEKPSSEVLIGFLHMVRGAYQEGNYKSSLNMIDSHEVIARQVAAQDVYNLFCICQREGNLKGTHHIMKVMLQRELVTQKVIDDFIFFRAQDGKDSGKDMWYVFQMARSLNIQPGPHAANMLLRVFKENQVWPTFWEVLLYLTENEAYQVPPEFVQVALAATIVNPNCLAATVAWLKEADQQMLRIFDKQLLQDLVCLLQRHKYEHIAGSLQYLLASPEDGHQQQRAVALHHGKSLLGEGPRNKMLPEDGHQQQRAVALHHGKSLLGEGPRNKMLPEDGHQQQRAVALHHGKSLLGEGPRNKMLPGAKQLVVEATREEDPEIRYWMQNVQSISFTKNWEVLANLYIDMCSRQCPLEGRFVEEVTHTLVKDLANAGTSFREFIVHVNKLHDKNKRENPIACLDKDGLTYIGNELVYACYNQGLWLPGSKVVTTEIEHDILSLHTTVPNHYNMAALALETCIKAKNWLLAVQVLRATDMQQLGLPVQQYILGLFPSLMNLLAEYGSLESCFKILEFAFAMIFSGQQPMMYDKNIFSLSRVGTALIQKCLEGRQWDIAVSTFQLFHKHSAPLSAPIPLKRCLLITMERGGFEEDAGLLFEELKRLGVYPVPSFNFPRVIKIKGFHTATEAYLLVRHYLQGLYNFFCEQILENITLRQRDLNVGICVEPPGAQPKDRTMMYVGEEEEVTEQLIQSILRHQFSPPLQTTYTSHGLAIAIHSLETYLQALDQTGRRQGLVFQRQVQDRLSRRGGNSNHQRINRPR